MSKDKYDLEGDSVSIELPPGSTIAISDEFSGDTISFSTGGVRPTTEADIARAHRYLDNSTASTSNSDINIDGMLLTLE